MRIIARRTLREFWERHRDAEEPLKSWFVLVKVARWESPADVKAFYRTASFLSNNRVVFNIKGLRATAIELWPQLTTDSVLFTFDLLVRIRTMMPSTR